MIQFVDSGLGFNFFFFFIIFTIKRHYFKIKIFCDKLIFAVIHLKLKFGYKNISGNHKSAIEILLFIFNYVQISKLIKIIKSNLLMLKWAVLISHILSLSNFILHVKLLNFPKFKIEPSKSQMIQKIAVLLKP